MNLAPSVSRRQRRLESFHYWLFGWQSQNKLQFWTFSDVLLTFKWWLGLAKLSVKILWIKVVYLIFSPTWWSCRRAVAPISSAPDLSSLTVWLAPAPAPMVVVSWIPGQQLINTKYADNIANVRKYKAFSYSSQSRSNFCLTFVSNRIIELNMI